jgi:tRNA(Ile)-lysidine synthase
VRPSETVSDELVRSLDAWFAARLPGYPNVRLCLALSGGGDSIALLGLLARLRDARKPLRLRALHVDHHLHPGSGEWSRRCRAVARGRRVPFAVLQARIPRAKGRSLEADAREARYALLREALQDGEVLLTAQHAEDQLETVLLQLLRGAGVKGLAAMPDIAPFGRGLIARPLLEVERAALLAWARGAGLEWIDDPSNADDRFDRNFLRLRVLPALRARWPGAASAAVRTARHAAEAQQLLDVLGRADVERAADGAALSVHVLRTLSAARRRNALRYWIARHRIALPDATRLREIAGPLLAAREGANPRVAWGGVVVTRHGDRLRLDAATAPAHDEPQSWDWKSGQPLDLPRGLGTLSLVADPRGPIDLDRAPDRVTVRPRRGGEHLELEPDGPRRSLKSLLQAAKVDPTERARLPVVLDAERVLAAGDRWIDVSIRALTPTGRRSRLTWRRPSN